MHSKVHAVRRTQQAAEQQQTIPLHGRQGVTATPVGKSAHAV